MNRAKPIRASMARRIFRYPNGYYDERGVWHKTKHCFVYCGAACDCGPPFGLHYDRDHDQSLKAPEPECYAETGKHGCGCAPNQCKKEKAP